MKQSSIIRILPEAVANKIAAGEVVERPASVVKELLENSLDAGATRLDVAVEAGGRRLIRVGDDGAGMTRDDAMLAFERHATSKIRSAEDLFAIGTLGFRGEALPSIAAVSKLVLETRHASDAAGTRVEFAGGRLRDVQETEWPSGTRVEVRDLFFNTPARRKFLKSESTELGHIASLVTHYALAHPEKSFKLASLTNEIVNVAPVATLAERIYQLMGAKTLEQMVEIPAAERALPAFPLPGGPADEETEEVPGAARVMGFVSRPEIQKLNRNSIYFFVNRRLVRDRPLLHAVTEAYRNILPSGMFPVALIFLELPTTEVDVNVHPSKTEVRFRHSHFIHDFVRDSIRGSLLATRPVAGFPAAKRDSEDAEVRERLGEDIPVPRGGMEQSGRGTAADFNLSRPQPPPETGRLPLDAAEALSAPLAAESHATEPVQPLPIHTPAGAEFPTNLRPLGQVQDSFIVATNEEGLWLIDQHVAHERVLFEQHARRRQERKVEGQRLLMPLVVELTPEQEVVFQQIAEELAANGFEVEPFGKRTVAVKTAPAEVRAEEIEKLLVEVLDGAGQGTRAISLETLRNQIAASVACHAAIKVNMPLDTEKMAWVLRELARTEYPMSCPHGRPTVLRYGLKEIWKAFKRT
jgi:DNA mismatch repair protein MutL